MQWEFPATSVYFKEGSGHDEADVFTETQLLFVYVYTSCVMVRGEKKENDEVLD